MRAQLLSAPLEVLNLALVFLRGLAGLERAQVLSLARLRVFLARIEPVVARFESSDHGSIQLLIAGLFIGKAHASAQRLRTAR